VIAVPGEAKLATIEKELLSLPAGAQRSAGGGIYMRLDRSGRRRYMFRYRDCTRRQPSGTYDSWEEAHAALTQARREVEARDELGIVGPTTATLRRYRLARYAREVWWPSAETELDDLTLFDYRAILWRDVLPVLGDFTLEQLELSPLLMDRIKARIVKHKRFPVGHRRAGEVPLAACDAVLKVGSSICEHARRRGVIGRNPFSGIVRFQRRRTPGRRGRGGHRRVQPTEVKHPRVVARVGLGMRGSRVQIEERRLVPELIAYEGLRPSDVLALRHRDWREEQGAVHTHLKVDSAVKNLGGHLLEGEPKTGSREPYLFAAVVEQLERVYEAQGRPPLDHLVCPDSKGELVNWGNWRRDVWYPALERAGLAAGPGATAEGAFEPYLLRHIGCTVMAHAQRHDTDRPATYSLLEVARQFGHSVDTLEKVYADIPDDMHGIAGLTVDQIIRTARREAWGPFPGDSDYEEVLYTLAQASVLTGISHSGLCARVQRGYCRQGAKTGSTSSVSSTWSGSVSWRRRAPIDLPSDRKLAAITDDTHSPLEAARAILRP
jgi:hypothetical protein